MASPPPLARPRRGAEGTAWGRNRGLPRRPEDAGQGWEDARRGEEGGLRRQPVPRAGSARRTGSRPRRLPSPEKAVVEPPRHRATSEAALGETGSRAAHEPARARAPGYSAGYAAASPRGLLSASRPTAGDSPAHPVGLGAPSRVSPPASRARGGVRQGAHGGRALPLGYRAATLAPSVPPPSHRRLGPYGCLGGRGSRSRWPCLPSPASRVLVASVPQRPAGLEPFSIPTAVPALRPGIPVKRRTPTTFPLPSSLLEVKNWGRAPRQHLPQRTRGDAASKKKYSKR